MSAPLRHFKFSSRLRSKTMLLCPPTEEIMCRMKEQLYQDPRITKQDVQHLREWLKKQPHLPQDIEDEIFERFLHGCKYSLERCKRVIDGYYYSRTILPQYFSNRDPTGTDIREVNEVSFFFPLRNYTPEGYRVFVSGLFHSDASKFDAVAFGKRCFMVTDLYASTEPCYGVILIQDMRLGNAHHFFKATAAVDISKTKYFQNVGPLIGKQVHIIYSSSLVKNVMAFYKTLVKEKIYKRVHIHDALESLYEYVPRDILPNDYGGESGTIKELSDAWQAELESQKDFFLEDEKRKSDETKRPKKSENDYDIFGVQGSFKDLNID